jgi:hypothetical protein
VVAVLLVLLGLLGLDQSHAAGAAPASDRRAVGHRDSSTPAAIAAPNTLLQNNQVVTVSWSGMPPTSTTLNLFTQYRNDDVAILECTAHPPDGYWYFFRDCYTQGENLGGNMVSPSGGVQATEIPLDGSTARNGIGDYPFQVQEGTLQTQEVQFACTTTGQSDCNHPYNVQCDISHGCVLKVVALPNGAPPIPNEIWQGPPTPAEDTACAANALACSYTQLLDGAPEIPLNFGPVPNCPSVSANNLAIEGATSASYALESWAAALCTGPDPITVSYSQVADDAAKTAFLAHNTTVGVASLPPTRAQVQAASDPPSYLAAPLVASGVSIVFNMVDPVTGLPIGCSANQPVAQCATPIRLTPRLVAMLITNSATVNAEEPFGHYGLTGRSRFIEPLTADPEFEALNPGFHPPGICVVHGKNTKCTSYVEEPVLRAEQLDDTYTLTQWIVDDHDAQRFLAGVDPCGAKLNRDWKNATYPSTQFQELAETSSGTTPDADSYYPVSGTSSVLQAMLYGVPVGGPPAAPGSPKTWLPAPTDNYAFFGVMDTVSARRSGLPSAQLIAANPKSSELSNLVINEGGKCIPVPNANTSAFVADNDTGLAAGYRAMTANPDGTLAPPVETTNSSAYPLAEIDYGFVPASGISPATAGLVAALLRFSAGPGQTSRYLPPGYTPLPANLQVQALSVAAKVVADAAPAPTKPSVLSNQLPPGSTVPGFGSLPGSRPGPFSATGVTGAAAAGRSTAGRLAGLLAAAGDGTATTDSGGSVSPRPLHESALDAAAGILRSGGWLLPAAAVTAGIALAAGGYMRTRARRGRART